MTQHKNPATADFENQLARLVDGELSGEAYRTFVASLDSHPHLWRLCGLAFLEAQALRGELRGWMADTKIAPAPVAPVDPAVASPSPPVVKVHPIWQDLSPARWWPLAACVVLSFLLGRGSLTAPRQNPPDDQVATVQVPSSSHTTPEEYVAAGEIPAEFESHIPAIPQGQVSLVVHGEHPQRRQLPVYDESQIDEHLFSPLGAWSSEMERALESAGMQVERHREYIPLRIDGGREMIVPVERVRVSPKPAQVY